MNELARHLNVRWLGRMEFADALALQEEIVAKKREEPRLKTSCFFSNTNRFIPLGGLLIGPVCSGYDICSIRFFRSIAAVRRRITDPVN